MEITNNFLKAVKFFPHNEEKVLKKKSKTEDLNMDFDDFSKTLVKKKMRILPID